MNQRAVRIAILAVAIMMTPGCVALLATHAAVAVVGTAVYGDPVATADPTADLGAVRSIYVKRLYSDSRGVNVLIAEKLTARGYVVTTGPEKPVGVDAIVTYADQWKWELWWQMTHLVITIRDPATDYPLVSGSSLNFAGFSPEDLVDRILSAMLKKAN